MYADLTLHPKEVKRFLEMTLLSFLSTKRVLPCASSSFSSMKRSFMRWPVNRQLPEVPRSSDIFKGNTASVVTIETTFFDPKEGVDLISTGSGIIWNPDLNIIVTCFHVISDAILRRRPFRVGFFDGTSCDGELINADPIRDIAVISIPDVSFKLKGIELGKAYELRMGQTVYTIGYPRHMKYSFRRGIVSGLKRNRLGKHGKIHKDAIQMDCAIGPGNSGGPVLDSMGRCVGMCSASYSLNIFLAIRVELISETVDKLLKLRRLFAVKGPIEQKRESGVSKESGQKVENTGSLN